jgi:hypothetical protein
MGQSIDNKKANGTHAAATLTDQLAALCQEETTCLSRNPGSGEVIPRTVDPNEKPRTAGARTAGG